VKQQRSAPPSPTDQYSVLQRRRTMSGNIFKQYGRREVHGSWWDTPLGAGELAGLSMRPSSNLREWWW